MNKFERYKNLVKDLTKYQQDLKNSDDPPENLIRRAEDVIIDLTLRLVFAKSLGIEEEL